MAEENTMSLLLPFSDDSKFLPGGIWAPTQANFSWLSHCFLCPETSGLFFDDSVGGLRIAGVSEITDLGNNCRDTPVMSDLTGTVTQSTKKALMIFAGTPNATTSAGGTLNFGANTGAAIVSQVSMRFTTRSGQVCQVGNGTAVNGPATRAGDGNPAIYALAANYGSATGLVAYDFDGTTFNTVQTGDISGIASIAFSNAMYLGVTQNPAMFLLGYFDTLPNAASLKSGLEWMYANIFDPAYLQANKRIYPGWSDAVLGLV